MVEAKVEPVKKNSAVGAIIGWFLLLIVLVVVAYAGYMIWQQQSNAKSRQAIFLDNGQIYFAYVVKENKMHVVIRDVYYLQFQPATQGATTTPPASQQASIVKLGDELHGPKDEMRINRDHVLFIEDMKDESKVNEIIGKFAGSGGTMPVPTASGAVSPQPVAQ
jgi:hypothetical protein